MIRQFCAVTKRPQNDYFRSHPATVLVSSGQADINDGRESKCRLKTSISNDDDDDDDNDDDDDDG